MAGRWGKLYRDSTPAELAMEVAIAELGVPYRNQFPGYLYGFRYFPDFLLPTLKLIIEVDDDSHFTKAKKETDATRTEELNSMGWIVVRCTNSQALGDARGVLREMLNSAGIQYPIRQTVTLAEGLPQKSSGKRKLSRGEIRERKYHQRAREMSDSPQALN